MIGIVGGGIAGLAAAYRLQQRGHEVQVFEASDDVGGLAATYETERRPIEKFYHHLSKSEETIVDLAEELGFGDDLEWPIGKNAYYVDGVGPPARHPVGDHRLPAHELLRQVPTRNAHAGHRRSRRDSEVRQLRAISRTTRTSPSRTSCSNTPRAASTRTSSNPLLDAKFGSRKGRRERRVAARAHQVPRRARPPARRVPSATSEAVSAASSTRSSTQSAARTSRPARASPTSEPRTAVRRST